MTRSPPNDPHDPFSPERRDVLFRMGVALQLIQSVEKSLRMTMTFVIQREGGLTLEKLQAQEQAEAEKTIGYFLSQLRHRVDVDPSLDRRLRRFLDLRNVFIHDLGKVPGWGTETEGKRRASHAFLAELISEAYFLMMVFSGLMKSWADQCGFDLPFEDDEIQRLMDKQYVPIAEGAFYPKGTIENE